ncbi:hypothetical protein GCM10028801_00020 [Nocardioides maradonensis]
MTVGFVLRRFRTAQGGIRSRLAARIACRSPQMVRKKVDPGRLDSIAPNALASTFSHVKSGHGS